MKLEPPFVIAESKLTNYLLAYRDKDDKSNYLRLAGYKPENSPMLEHNLLSLAGSGEAVFKREDEYGLFYSVTGELVGPNSRRLPVMTIWMRDMDEEITKFITLYPPRQ